MSNASEEQILKTQPLASGRPSGFPKAPRNPEDPTRPPRKTILVPDPMLVRDLAIALHVKPFKVVADLLELKVFKSIDDPIDFDTAALVARKHGFRADRPPPGMLVL